MRASVIATLFALTTSGWGQSVTLSASGQLSQPSGDLVAGLYWVGLFQQVAASPEPVADTLLAQAPTGDSGYALTHATAVSLGDVYVAVLVGDGPGDIRDHLVVGAPFDLTPRLPPALHSVSADAALAQPLPLGVGLTVW